jgi:hypothetical protein
MRIDVAAHNHQYGSTSPKFKVTLPAYPPDDRLILEVRDGPSQQERLRINVEIRQRVIWRVRPSDEMQMKRIRAVDRRSSELREYIILIAHRCNLADEMGARCFHDRRTSG